MRVVKQATEELELKDLDAAQWNPRTIGGIAVHSFRRKHDVILFYTVSGEYVFYPSIIPRGYEKCYKGLKKVKSVGRFLEDWWIDIASRGTATNSKQWVGYPTQKPEALLERIIKSSSKEDAVVADFFCGSGTALVVAQRLGRKWIGCDSEPTAITITRSRIEQLAFLCPDCEKGVST